MLLVGYYPWVPLEISHSIWSWVLFLWLRLRLGLLNHLVLTSFWSLRLLYYYFLLFMLVSWYLLLLLLLLFLIIYLNLAFFQSLQSRVFSHAQSILEECWEHLDFDSLLVNKVICILSSLNLCSGEHFPILVVLNLGKIPLDCLSSANHPLKHVSNVHFLKVLGVKHTIFSHKLIESSLLVWFN